MPAWTSSACWCSTTSTIDDEQQLAFSRAARARSRQATGDIAAPQDRRMSMDLNDISNLDKNNEVLARDDRRRLFGLGNQLWHSDSSFKDVPAKYSLLSARKIPPTGGNTEFADMRAAYDALDEETKREVARPDLRPQPDLLARHPGLHRLHRGRAREVGAGAPAPGARHPDDRPAVALSREPCRRHRRLAGARGARLPARPHRARHAAQVRLCPCLEAVATS